MTTRSFGQRIRRNEDPDLLRGTALFTDDVQLPGMLHAAFLRSDVAHGRLHDVNVAAARGAPGVVAVFTAEDLGALWRPGPLLVPPPPIAGMQFEPRCQVPLAKDKIRYAGEPIAMVIATDRYRAEDALALVEPDLEPLPAVVDLESAQHSHTALVHDDVPFNLHARVKQSKGNYRRVRDAAHLVVGRRFTYAHGAACALENRGVVAQWDARARHLTVWDTTQAPIPIRAGLAGMFDLAEQQVRVIAPCIGGGFGPKIMMFYPEEILVPWVAMRLGAPVKWIEDRHENFHATTQERGQIHWAEMAVAEDGRILGVKDTFLHDAGAYAPYGLTVPLNSQCTLLGCYDLEHYESEFLSLYTNLPIVTPYRGAGRQHGIFVMERLIDLAARELGQDPAAMRRRNLIPPDKFPYNHQIIYQDFEPLLYDSGNYEPCLDKALEAIGYADFRRRAQPRFRQADRWVGIGVVTYVEGTGIGPYEGAHVSVGAGGHIHMATGVGTQGQGHFTSFAQIVADELGVSPADVRVSTGDTNLFHWGAGTFASRGAVVAGNAVHRAAAAVRAKALLVAGDLLEADPEDLEVRAGGVQVKGAPDSHIPLGRIAQAANPLRGTAKYGSEPGLEAAAYYGPERGTTANGVHAMILEVDRLTYDVTIHRYVVVHDCGTVINPLILDGQIQGGVAQGIGNAFYEDLRFDPEGQLLNASFMDYLLPTAVETPAMEIHHLTTPATENPLGIKGAGEAGAIPVAALFAQAIEDAMADSGIEILSMPMSPDALFALRAAAQAAGAG